MSFERIRTKSLYLARVHGGKYEVFERFPFLVRLFARQVGDVQLEKFRDFQQTNAACGQFVVHTPPDHKLSMVFTSHPL